MSEDNRPNPLLVALAVCAAALLLAVWAWRTAGDRAESARLAWSDVEVAREYAAQLGDGPNPDATPMTGSPTAVVAAAAEAAGLAPEQVPTMQASDGRTSVDVTGVTLDELMALREALPPALVVTAAKLAPDGDDAGDRWRAELTLELKR